MAREFNIVNYMSSLTGFTLDESVFRRIAVERGVDTVENEFDLTERDRDLLTADIIYTILLSPSTIPSFQHQHGQFSVSIGQQKVNDRDYLFRLMLWLYRRWDDKFRVIPETACLEWHF